MKLYALCAALALTNIAHADTDDASQILQHARAASGGDAWNTVAALHAKGEEHAAGLTAQWQGIDDLHGGRNAQHADFGVFKIAEGFDDREHWRMDRSEAVHALDSTFARSATATDAWLARRGWLRAGADGAMLSAASNRTDAGHTYNVVTATPRNGQPVELWFDAQTGLLARNVRVMPISIQTTRYDDYRDVAGVKLPFAITTDHGELQGDFGLLFKGPYHCEALMHIPFIWRPAPDADVAPAEIRVPVGQIDIAPTLCEIAGVPIPEWMQGRPLPTNPVGPTNGDGRERVITEWDSQFGHIGMHLRSMWRDGWLCTVYLPSSGEHPGATQMSDVAAQIGGAVLDATVHYDGTEGELYNLTEDPNQWHNLWDDPAARAMRSDLVADLLDHLPPVRDPVLPIEAPT